MKTYRVYFNDENGSNQKLLEACDLIAVAKYMEFIGITDITKIELATEYTNKDEWF